MRQNKVKLEGKPKSLIQVKLPMVRNFSTGGGHLPGDTLVEGDDKIVTKKWQGYPPQNLSVIGKPMPPLPEVAIPRFFDNSEYATSVCVGYLIISKFLTCLNVNFRISYLDILKAYK